MLNYYTMYYFEVAIKIKRGRQENKGIHRRPQYGVSQLVIYRSLPVHGFIYHSPKNLVCIIYN